MLNKINKINIQILIWKQCAQKNIEF